MYAPQDFKDVTSLMESFRNTVPITYIYSNKVGYSTIEVLKFNIALSQNFLDFFNII